MQFLLTIDTEGDNQWDHGRALSVENIKYVPRFQELCNRYDVKPTYLVTSEICEDAFAKEIFTDYVAADQAEIGAHLHSWTTPPFLDKSGYRFNDPKHAFAHELSPALLTEKVENLTSQIENAFGKRPTSFRSGRYGFNENVARVLAANGYLVDSSVTPYSSWISKTGIPGGEGGPNFLDKTPFPYRYAFTDNSLLEIPLTILPTRFPLNKYKNLAEYYFRNVNESIFLRLFRKLLFTDQPLWLRPYLSTSIQSFEELIKEAETINLPFLVMMFHSSELMPGCSIYRETEDDIEKLYELLELFFALLQKKAIPSSTLTEAAKNFSE